jgi:gluconolactonase
MPLTRALAILGCVWLSTAHGISQEPTRVAGIPGVVADGATLELVKGGFTDTEGPLPTSDGGLYFTEQRTSRIYRLQPDGTISIFHEQTNAANGLAFDPKGNILVAEGDGKRISRIDKKGSVSAIVEHPTPDQDFLRPNDLIADGKGGVYVTDPGPTTNTGKSYVYYVRPDGVVVVIADDIARPNGLTLTNDGKILLVDDTRGNTVFAFDVQPDGSVRNKRPFARLQDIPADRPSIADGMALDRDGRIYVTTVVGIQIFDRGGQYVGMIPPRQAQNIAFGGRDKRTLFIEARGALYRLAMLAQGPRRLGK